MEEYEKFSANTFFRYLVLVIVGLILVYPLAWMIGSGFKDNIDIFGNLSIFPPAGRVRPENYANAWQINKQHILPFYFFNTLKFLIPKTIFTVISSSITAYAVARFSFPGKKFVFTAIIVTLLMPELAFRIPLYLFYTNIGLRDNYATLYITDIFATNSFFVFMIIQFMRSVPKELDEAAKIDGCNAFQILLYVIVPVIKPIIITVALLCFMWGMNDFQGPLIYLTSPDKAVLSLVLKQQLDGDQVISYGKLFAASTIALTPIIIIFFSGSRYFVDGVASTGGKE